MNEGVRSVPPPFVEIEVNRGGGGTIPPPDIEIEGNGGMVPLQTSRRDDPRSAVKIEANGGAPPGVKFEVKRGEGGCTPPGVERIAGRGGYNPPCWFENEANEEESSLLLGRNRRDVGWRAHPSPCIKAGRPSYVGVEGNGHGGRGRPWETGQEGTSSSFEVEGNGGV